jgi:transcriptional regulator with GAF, ATPase, and Fis domain
MSRAPGPSEDFLAPLLEALGESLDVQETFARISAEARRSVPHDFLMHGIVSEDRRRVRLVALSGELPGGSVEVLVADPLRVLMERPGAFVLNDMRSRPGGGTIRGWLRADGGDARQPIELPFQPTFRELGARSTLHVTLRLHGGVLGGLLFCSSAPDAFPAAEVRTARHIASCVAVALEHDRLWREEHERRRRHDALQPLLPALAQALDIRAIFAELSRITQDVLPHDYVSLGLFNEDHSAIHVHATSEDMGMLPEFRFTDDVQVRAFEADYFIARDIEVAPPDAIRVEAQLPHSPKPGLLVTRPGPRWVEVYAKTGVRAQVRVPVRLEGRVAGGLTFHSRTPGLYSLAHVELAVRVADHVALALAHRKLAEESRRAVAAQARASQLEERVQVLVEELETRSPHRALGRSQRWRDVLDHAAKVAPTDTTVLMTGESGTGKEVVARFIHRGSSRKGGPFVALNCAALPEQLLESELFGHERGAFTGALNARAGKIEQAAGGVLFLDEVGEMSPSVQAKFLRVLQEREYERLGGSRTLKADMRVLAATNRNLKAAIAQGGFREDLYYRLAVFDIALPPLRERAEDIPLLVAAFLEEIGRSVGRPAAGLSQGVLETLVAYAWPGNVRELRNAIERAVILAEGGLLTTDHLPLGIASPRPLEPLPRASGPEPSERERILEALKHAGNNQSKAARLLGLTRAQIRARIEKHGISIDG